MRVDVAIAGAGVGGAVLALALGRRGHRVALVERDASPPRLARPEILWSATFAALDGLGIGPRILAESAVPLEAIEVAGPEGPLLTLSREDFTAAGTRPHSTNPTITRALLLEEALATGCVEVHRGVAIDGLLKDGERVAGLTGRQGDASFVLEARLVVGDDGTQSVVRKSLGIAIELSPFPIDFITAEIRWPAELAPDRGYVRLNPASFREGLPVLALLPWPGGAGVLLLPLPHDRADRLFAEGSVAFWEELCRLSPVGRELWDQLEFPGSFARVKRPFGHAATYSAEGAAILGDAAHPMTPAGGQGANAAIGDALALAETVDSGLRSGGSTVPREALLAYEKVRRPMNARSVAISRSAGRAFRFGGRLPLPALVPVLARLAEHAGFPKRLLLRRFGAAFVSG